MGRKRIVLAIVEGPSDREALGPGLTEILEPNGLHVEIVHTDITSETAANAGTIRKAVGSIVSKCMSAYKFRKSDILKVLQIIDTDGAYVPDSQVVWDPAALKPVYSPGEIKTCDRDMLIQRNHRKRSNMDVLASTLQVSGNIPYSACYMSSNLDHVLYDRLNTDDEEKALNAHAFARKFKNDPRGFLGFISSSEFSVTGNHLESWNFIRKNGNSLKRYTNLGIELNDLINFQISEH